MVKTPRKSVVTIDLTGESDSVADDHDELDVMHETVSSPPTRILRTRVPNSNTMVSQMKNKRVRTLSASALESQSAAQAAKKMKMDDKKAATAIVSGKRQAMEAARRRWIHRHRQLFEPLLPSTAVLDNITAELDRSNDKRAYVPIHQLEEQPSLIKGGEMKDYQLQGLSFLVWMYNNGMNCILGDEMGLGKTLQTLSLLAHVRENAKGQQDPHLIICPLSVLSSWLAECGRWLPSFKAIRFHGQASERARLKDAIRTGELKFDICITTYDSYMADDGWFKTRRWTYCVLDEGHKIKHAETGIARAVQGIGALYRLILTGTPVQNNMTELWGLLHWLFPTLFTNASERLFRDAFALERGSYSVPFLNAANALLGKVMLRRTKDVVERSVPPRDELTVFIPLTEAQRFWTYRLLTRMDTVTLEQIYNDAKQKGGYVDEGRREVLSQIQAQVTTTNKDNKDRWKKLMNLLMQLRKVCDHPYLLAGAEPEPFSNGEHVVAASSKIIAIDKLLADILPKGERVLIFSQWTTMLDLLEDFMALRDIPYARLDGQTSRPRRALDIKLFQQEKSPYKVFLISTKAGGLGINLTKASTVVMCDSEWNPQNDLQAIARAHRIGQTRTVKVYRLICRGSVEDQMLDRIRRKLFLSLKVMGSDSPGSSDNDSESALRSSELMDILRKGSSALSGGEGGMDLARFVDAPISEILETSRSLQGARETKMKRDLDVKAETGDNNTDKMIADAEEEERKLLCGVAQVQSRLFEGKFVQKNNKEIASEWKELQKRAHVDRSVVVDGMRMIVSEHPYDVRPPPRIPDAKKKSMRKFENEDYCNYCRDGGELVLCTRCPRVFHAKCHGMTKAEVARASFVTCSQHACSLCFRNTADAGGMLFRCQTCPQAFCEDCLPDDQIDAVGDVLPEFLLLGHGAQSTAYYIRCHDCHAQFAQQPELWQAWQEEMRETDQKLKAFDNI